MISPFSIDRGVTGRVALTAIALAALQMLPQPGLREGYDWVRMHVFYKTYFRETVLGGALPLWNPYSALGRPFLADAETATLYPPNLLYLAGVNTGLAANLFLHFGLLLLGMLALARRLGCRELTAWFGALAFALGAPLLGRLQSGQLQVFCSLCWLPVVLVAALGVRERPGARGAVRLAAAVALMFLAGSPPMFWVAGWMVIVVLAVEWSRDLRAPGQGTRLAWLAGAGALAAGLAAVQMLPFLELVAQGNRQHLPAEYALVHGIKGASWLSLLTSRPLGAFSYWEHNLYAGLPLVAAAPFALARWRTPAVLALIAVVAVFALLAAGDSTPLLPWLVAHVPGWNDLRFPPRYGIPAVMALCLLGALGLEQIARRVEASGTGRRAAFWFCAALLVLNAGECVRAHFERAHRYAGPPVSGDERKLAEEFRAAGLLEMGQPPPRVVAPPWIIRENAGLLHGYGTLTGFGNPFLGNVWTEIHRRLQLDANPRDPVNVPVPAFVVPASAYAGLDISARWDPETKRTDPPFRAPERAQLDGPGRARVVEFSGERIVVQTSANQPRRLLLAEPWYPGWRASVDGAPAEVQAAGWMRAVNLAAGENRVVFTYRPPLLAWGAGITFVALLLAGGLWSAGKTALLPSSR